MKKVFYAMLGLCLLPCGSLSAAEQKVEIDTESVNDVAVSEATAEEQSFADKYIKNKLSIGTRITHRFMTDDDSGQKGGVDGDGTFLGTIYALDVDQSYTPDKLFVNYKFTDYIGLELAYDKIEAKTLATTHGDLDLPIKSDGDVSLSGPTITVRGYYPNESKFTPYAGIGVGIFSGDFDEADHWALGYQSPEHYAASGTPGVPLNGYERYMDIDDDVAFIFTAGSTFDLFENLYLDFSFQYMAVDADATFKTRINGVETSFAQSGSFPLSNMTLRFGIGYTF